MSDLVESRRAVFASTGDREFWVASEKVADFTSTYVDVSFTPDPPSIPSTPSTPDSVLDRALLGWMQITGPVTSEELSTLLSVGEAVNRPASVIPIDSLVNSVSETIDSKDNRFRPSFFALEASLLRLESTGAILRGHFRTSAGPLEWCDRRLLARIHRLTVATLRKQIEPATAAQFMRWLLRWQHIAPGAQLRGERGLLEVLRQLQGFEIAANAWERHVLAVRVVDYDPATLDHLCLMGATGWGRLSPHPATLDDAAERTRRVVPTSVAPITFFLREDCNWMSPRVHDDVSSACLSASARLVWETLQRRGALFFADLHRLTGLLRCEVEDGLWELVAAGFVTADAFDNLRGLISRNRHVVAISRNKRPRNTSGRWSLLWSGEDNSDDALSETSSRRSKHAPPKDERMESLCWMLLRRYGIVFREVLAREPNLPRWRELQWAFRRLEDRGEIRGGRFVSGFVGEQFAMPIAAESLRESRSLPASGETFTISAADPLNLVGIIVPGERIPASSLRSVTLRDGVYVHAVDAPTLLAPLSPPPPNDAREHETAV